MGIQGPHGRLGRAVFCRMYARARHRAGGLARYDGSLRVPDLPALPGPPSKSPLRVVDAIIDLVNNGDAEGNTVQGVLWKRIINEEKNEKGAFIVTTSEKTAAIQAFFDLHCKNHPLDDLVSVTTALLGEVLAKIPMAEPAAPPARQESVGPR